MIDWVMRNFLLLSLVLASFCINSTAYAISVIRDSEIEEVIANISNPIFTAANLNPSAMRVVILHDPEINAFVTGGLTIYIHTGLLTQCANAEVLAGVIAHETGHIMGGHVLRTRDSLKNLNLQMVAGYMLGVAAGVLGSPEAGQAILLGNQHVAERNMLKYSRNNEETADQSAISLLEKVGYSAEGLTKLFELLEQNQRLVGSKPDPYTLTHPLTQERIASIRHHIAAHKNGKGIPKIVERQFQLAKVKLKAFLSPPEKTLAQYPPSNLSMEATYARAIAYYRTPDLNASLDELEELLQAEPNNPFFHELKGQILFENGVIPASIESYNKAQQLRKDDPLIEIQLASAQLASNDTTLYKAAIDNLEMAVRQEPENGAAWRLLATAYGKVGDLGRSYAALAEEAFLKENKKDIHKFVELAKKHLPENSPSRIRVEDILMAIGKD